MENDDVSLTHLRSQMSRLGVTLLLAKELAPNDNSKNQIYLGGGFEALSILPVGSVRAEETEDGRETLKAPFPLGWLLDDGTVSPAPSAQLILYPQYPEIRLSGVLLRSANSPSTVIGSRDAGRILFFGITRDGRVIGKAAGPTSRLAADLSRLSNLETTGVFAKIPLRDADERPREKLLAELRRIHMAGWLPSRALNSNGSFRPCNAVHCVGYTLEAELGVARNGYSEPDFLGWEVKAAQVPQFSAATSSKAQTLLTPEPNGGFYQSGGAKEFVRRFGYPDKLGRPDRLNFGGIFRARARHGLTGLTLDLAGYDTVSKKITDAGGAIVLRDDKGTVAAAWSYAKLATHWNRKHAQAVYVPAECSTDGGRRYRYGQVVRVGEGTDFLRFLDAVAQGVVYYDPAIKIEEASGGSPRLKRRSQFRIRSGDLAALYQSMRPIDLLDLE